MSEQISVEELRKNKAYRLLIADREIVAMKLADYGALKFRKFLRPMTVGSEAGDVEGDDWLLIVKDSKDLPQPLDVWVRKVSDIITEASGAAVGTLGVVVSSDILSTKEQIARLVTSTSMEKYPLPDYLLQAGT